MSNIEKFDEYVGRIFGILYESFPIPIKLSVEQILDLDDTQSVFNNPEFEHETLLVMHTIGWLAESKYIYTGKVYDTYCEYAVLTEGALLTLKSVPDTLKEKEKSLGMKCVDAVKSGSKETIKIVANQALALAIKMAISHY